MKTEHNITHYTFFKKLSFLPFVEKIILFGSRARKDNFDRSDIDLAIDCPNATIKEWLIILDIIDNADTFLVIDCIRYNKLLSDSLFVNQKMPVLNDT
jgi:predicted nucleotidyltransferase